MGDGEQHTEMARRESLRCPLAGGRAPSASPGDYYFDTKSNATGAYDVPATSYVVVINKAGKVVYTGLGGKQDLEAAIKKAL